MTLVAAEAYVNSAIGQLCTDNLSHSWMGAKSGFTPYLSAVNFATPGATGNAIVDVLSGGKKVVPVQTGASSSQSIALDFPGLKGTADSGFEFQAESSLTSGFIGVVQGYYVYHG